MAEEVVVRKEVLVVFGQRRRPVSYNLQAKADIKEEIDTLLTATKESFDGILDPAGEYYFQSQNTKYGDQLVDIVQHIPNGSTVYLFQESVPSMKVCIQFFSCTVFTVLYLG